jgi:hypothetical protein
MLRPYILCATSLPVIIPQNGTKNKTLLQQDPADDGQSGQAVVCALCLVPLVL